MRKEIIAESRGKGSKSRQLQAMQCLLQRTINCAEIFMTTPKLISELLRTSSRKKTNPCTYVTCQSAVRNMSSKSDGRNDDGVPDVSSPSSRAQNHETTLRGTQNAGTSTHNEKSTLNKCVLNSKMQEPTDGRVTRQSIHKQEEVDQCKEKYLSMDLESRRKLYKSKHVTLDAIKSWPQYFCENLKQKSKEGSANTGKQKDVRPDLNKKISLFQGDITTLEIDAIVNAANESLLGGGGVDGAIHKAAGPHLRAECETLHGCDAGDAKITCGYNLPAKYIIHTVGPRGEYPEVLGSCYKHCLKLVKEHHLTTVAFPCISTGIFGYPNDKAASVALNTMRQWLVEEEYSKSVERIILCLFLKVDVDAYERLMTEYFPC